jgi:hypothetical protein
MQFRKYTEEQLIESIKESNSIRQVLIKLDVVPWGGNYDTIKRYIKNLNIDISHFTGKLWSKGKIIGPKKPIEYYLIKNCPSIIVSVKLKKRLIKEGIFEHKCYQCDNIEWNGKPIPIELEHIDGDHYNNELSNLTILCPNCHAQTSTYRRPKDSLNKEKIIKKIKIKTKNFCKCGKEIRKKSKTCKNCRPVKRKVDRPSLDIIMKDVEELGYRGTGRKYGVSDNAIRKWIKIEKV